MKNVKAVQKILDCFKYMVESETDRITFNRLSDVRRCAKYRKNAGEIAMIYKCEPIEYETPY